LTTLKVLYLEDSPNDRDLTRLQLERASPGTFKITEAADLKGAVGLLSTQAFDVVLADLNVGDSQGIATITALLKAGCKAPIVAFTGNLDPKSGIEAVAAGASDFISKGITDPHTLANRILYAAKRGPSMPKEALEALVLERTSALNVALRNLQASNEALAEQKQRLEVFMQGVPVGCFLVDAETGRILFVSQAYENMFGRPRAGLLVDSNDWAKAVHPDDVARMMQPAAMGAPGSATSLEFRVTRRGEVRWIRASWTPIVNPAGRETHRAGIFEDITEARRVNQLKEDGRAKDAALALEQRNAAFKAQFLNMAAHDLATPVTPLVLQIASMRIKAKAAKDQATLDALAMMDRNLARLGGLIQDVLDVGRIEAGRVKLRNASLDLASVVRGELDIMKAMADDGKVTLASELAPVTLTADEARISQIVLNVINNAVKYTPPGGQVRVRLASSDGVARLEVEDSGRGISAEDLGRLFQPFTRVGDTTKVTGTGLGLYISRGLARMMGGDLVAASPGEGKGSTFTLTLPLAPPPEAPVAAAAS
jgi:PAS domain S-box-containing protein